MKELVKLEEKRQKILADYRKEQKVAIILMLAAIAFGALAYFFETFFFIFTAFAAIIAFVFFGKAVVHLNSFKKLVKEELIMMLLKQQFEDVYYNHKDYIPSSRIVQTGMVKRPDRFHGEDYIKGSYKGVKFEVADVDLKERVERRDSKGNVSVSYQTYFKGRWYIYQFGRTFKEVLKIVEGRGYQVNTRGLVKVDTESIEFNKKFSIYASTQEYGFYHITSSMIEKFLELEKLHRGSILYYFSGNELHIGVNDRKDYMELSLKTPINEESLKSFISDIDLIPAIINELRLDSSKFKSSL
ncbi:DUF3137 domain-containing protein [Peloplasma aerotolerans]|uniref:DUF3137 domain-containing protein n=1 Tax=Peloplasma aerotolerans TaxID=3044389 RepID=A0AAW6U9L7_9MOLU|nr:DUF3137 domain-containing protein [Mariniplasma sp. M4Ah]MDI6453410.1 DUF3137 domain-containing protein [Mariniplasma sp. M4Ah]